MKPSDISTRIAESKGLLGESLSDLRSLTPSEELNAAVSKLEQGVAFFTAVTEELERYLPSKEPRKIDKRTLEAQQKILEALASAPPTGFAISELGNTLGLSLAGIKYQIDKMVIQGEVRKVRPLHYVLANYNYSNRDPNELPDITVEDSSKQENLLDLIPYREALKEAFQVMRPLLPISSEDLTKLIKGLDGNPAEVIPSLLMTSTLRVADDRFLPSLSLAKECGLEMQLYQCRAWLRMSEERKSALTLIVENTLAVPAKPLTKSTTISTHFAVTSQAADLQLRGLSDMGFVSRKQQRYFPTQVAFDYVRPGEQIDLNEVTTRIRDERNARIEATNQAVIEKLTDLFLTNHPDGAIPQNLLYKALSDLTKRPKLAVTRLRDQGLLRISLQGVSLTPKFLVDHLPDFAPPPGLIERLANPSREFYPATLPAIIVDHYLKSGDFSGPSIVDVQRSLKCTKPSAVNYLSILANEGMVIQPGSTGSGYLPTIALIAMIRPDLELTDLQRPRKTGPQRRAAPPDEPHIISS